MEAHKEVPVVPALVTKAEISHYLCWCSETGYFSSLSLWCPSGQTMLPYFLPHMSVKFLAAFDTW